MKTALFLLGALLALSLPADAQRTRPAKGGERLRAFERHVALTRTSPKLPWRLLGPDNWSGRATDVAALPGDKNTLYAAFATGGLWKSGDGGASWRSLFDDQPTLSIGAIALAPSRPQTLYVGTGEANIFRASLAGVGVFRSDDGGTSFRHIGLENTGTIARILVHPADPETVWVAAGGNEWSQNADRGVYKSENGGKSWKRVLGGYGAIDIALDPRNPNVVYASQWNRIRRRWSDPVPEDGDHLYRTDNGGKSWTKLTEGLPPTKTTGRIGLALAASRPDTLYAFVDNHTPTRQPREGETDSYGRPRTLIVQGAEVYRSDNRGQSWRKVSQNLPESFSGTYGWVFGQIRVDPTDAETVYLMGLDLSVSRDGGKTFRSIGRGVHGDHHALWIDPTDPKRLYNGNDGGVNISNDGGATWTNFYRQIPTTQIYNVAYDLSTPFLLYGSVQDEGSIFGRIDFTYGQENPGVPPWRRAPGGEGTRHAIDPTDPTIVYSSTFYGRLTRAQVRERGAARTTSIAPPRGEGEDEHRGEWLAATILSPHNPKVVYHGMQYVFRSEDRGESWRRISPDLTYNDPKKAGILPYAISHQTITALDESPLKAGVLYAGTDDGRVHVTRDGGARWMEITRGLPKGAHVSHLVASKWAESVVYVSLSDRREDSIAPYVYRSDDYGKTWRSLAANLPPHPVNVVREDPKSAQILYVGTDMGLYQSLDSGRSWRSLSHGLPAAVSVQDLIVHPRDDKLVIATYGRGFYALDDLSSLRRAE